MRYFIWALLIGLAVFVGYAVNTPAAEKQEAVTTEQVKQQAREAVDAAKQYTMQEKQEYQKKLEAELADLGKQIDALKVKAKTAKQDVQAKLTAQLEDLKKKETDLAKQLPELRSSTSKAWEQVKGGMDKAMDDLKKAYENARSQFK